VLGLQFVLVSLCFGWYFDFCAFRAAWEGREIMVVIVSIDLRASRVYISMCRDLEGVQESPKRRSGRRNH